MVWGEGGKTGVRTYRNVAKIEQGGDRVTIKKKLGGMQWKKSGEIHIKKYR